MTKLVALFRVSTYLTLALATLCLGLAEHNQVEGGPVYFIVMSLAILVAYLVEGRWVMPRTVANLLALFILLAWVAWFQFSVSGVASAPDEGGGDLLQLALPRVGPLLAALLLAKLFRPKSTGDYWLMHLLALIQVVLACVLALSSRLDRENLLFGAVFGLYVMSSVWAVTLFYLYRENLRLAPRKGPEGSAKRLPDLMARMPLRGAGVVKCGAWFAAATVLALVLFFAMPRLSHDAAATLVMPGTGKAATGFNTSMDLNNTGPLEVNDERVMSVEARDQNGRAVNLGAEMRFRGVTCSAYERGQWRPRSPRSLMDVHSAQMRGALPPGVSVLSLTYDIDLAKLRTARVFSNDISESPPQPVFLAEPLFAPNGFPPMEVKARGDPTRFGLNYRLVECALIAPGNRRSRNLKYTQLYPSNSGDSPLWTQRVPNVHGLPDYDLNLRSLPPGLAAAGRIAEETRRILVQANVPASATRVQKARALETYLSTSPQFGYSLDWRRVDPTLDPTEDFLLNVKQGHCELFASALALMLRSQGIPARVIIGFRGAEWNDLAEVHEVRQYHAHAWVEARVGERPLKLTTPSYEQANQQEWTWLTLDPAPAGGTAGALGLDRGRWDDELHFLQFLWESFILDYSGESEQQRLMERLSRIEWLQDCLSYFADQRKLSGALSLVVSLAVLVAVIRALAKRRRKQAAPVAAIVRVAFYARLLKLLERLSLRPVLSQTPAEFAGVASAALALRPAAAELADVPSRVIEQFYAVRFGGRDLDAIEAAEIDRDLTRLRQALRG